MTFITYHVTGMTCGHCARAVTAELSAVGGVTDVTVGLVPGGASEVTVVSGTPLDDAAVQAALDEAGDYRLATPGNASVDAPGGQGPVPASRGAASRGPAGSPRERPIVE
jgi:copper chaperone